MTNLTQRQITRRIAKFQKAEAKGRITRKEMEGLMEGLAKTLREQDEGANRLPRRLCLHVGH